MLTAPTLDSLEERARYGFLDQYEALVLRRLQGPLAPERTVTGTVEIPEEETQRRQERAKLEVKWAQEKQADLEKRRQEAFAEIERRFGPQGLAAVKQEIQRRALMARAAQMAHAQAFVFPGAFGTSNTSTFGTSATGSSTFVFR